MKLGNITGDIYDRSIHKKLNMNRESTTIKSGAAQGENCAVFSFVSGDKKAEANAAEVRVAAARAQAAYTGEDCGRYAVYAAGNQAAAAAQTVPAGILLEILLPPAAQEQALRHIVEDAQEAADRIGTAIADVKAFVTEAVVSPVLTATAIAKFDSAAGGVDGMPAGAKEASADGGTLSGKRAALAGSQIVMTKWAGLEGSARLALRCREKLLERYPSYLLDDAAAFEQQLSVIPEAAAAGKSGVSAMCAAAEGGIFHALWMLAECAGVGLEIELKKIPIRQETVEICNYLDLNPYELAGNGSLLCLTRHGDALVRTLQKDGTEAAIIGVATAGHDRIVVNGEKRRFLEPAKMDEIYRILK